MVALLQAEAGLDQVLQHPVTQVDIVVGGSNREIPTLGADLVATVEAAVVLRRLAGVPPSRDRVDLVEGAVGARVEAHRVEDVELGLSTEVGGVGDPGALQVILRLAGDVARVARVGLEGEGVMHEEVQIQRLGLIEEVDLSCVGVGEEQHVRFVDRLEPAN